MKQIVPPWYRPRNYAHFDWPLSLEEAQPIATTPDTVARHAYMPLISFTITTRKYKKTEGKIAKKDRPIAMASHADSHIFAYYAHMLAEQYECKLQEKLLADIVLAYRRFETRKCNIDFANDAFNVIASRGRDTTAIGIDIEKFFDSLDHELLKRSWCELLDEPRLPRDHYSVFKAITRYAQVDREDLFKTFRVPIRTQRNWRRPLCKPAEFRTRVRGGGLIKPNRNTFGIPQGTPISALLSNVYMLKADEQIKLLCDEADAHYFRYSDDILLIVDKDKAAALEAAVIKVVDGQKLRVNSDKTIRATYVKHPDGKLNCDKPLQYLGFIFDGRRKLIRGSSIARFCRTRADSVDSARRAAQKAKHNGKSSTIRLTKLYRRFTHLGRRNFVSYAFRAAKRMGDKAIKGQMKDHWQSLEAAVQDAQSQII